jgi:peroxiredoxin
MAFEDLKPLAVGDTAPDFTLASTNGDEITLSELVKDKPAVVVFVPAAFTGLCTGEYCELRDNLSLFQDANVALVGISNDTKFTQRAWSDQEGLTFPLVSDFWPHGSVSRQYGVFLEEAGIAVRGTFVIDSTMTVRAAFVNPPGEPRPLAAYREAIAALS